MRLSSLLVVVVLVGVGTVHAAFSVHQHNIDTTNTWMATDDNFPDISDEDRFEYYQSLCGVVPVDDDNEEELPEHDHAPLSINIPEHFDAREHWWYCPSIGDVRNQGRCGSCYAFAAVETASDRVCIASEGKIDVRLSPEHIISCCYTCGHGCGGGDPGNTWRYIKRRGVVTGGDLDSEKGCYPYEVRVCNKTDPDCDVNATIATPLCRRNCRKGYDVPFEEDRFHADKIYQFKNNAIEKMQIDMLLYGPLSVAFHVYEDFMNYKSGVYQNTTSEAVGGHAVKMIGWGVEDDVPYWLCVNSWGPKWGDKGTFKILRGSNNCAIEDLVIGGTMKV